MPGTQGEPGGPGDADVRAGAAAPEAPAGLPLVPVDGAYFAELEPASITPNHVQPRQVFEEEAMSELVHSVREVGLLQPIVVRELSPGSYELIMGERRWRAAQQAGLDMIPAIVRQTDDSDMLRDALLENLHRAQLNPLEEASAYAQLLEDFGCTHDELAQRIGRSRPQISNTLRLALLAAPDAEIQDRLAQRVVAEGISVRGLEEIVAVGDTGTTKSRAVHPRPFAPGLVEISDRLADRFETRVKIDLGKSKGKITVEFATLEDLRRIVDIMDPRST
jgi:ParB family chromosome partitioning protein